MYICIQLLAVGALGALWAIVDIVDIANHLYTTVGSAYRVGAWVEHVFEL